MVGNSKCIKRSEKSGTYCEESNGRIKKGFIEKAAVEGKTTRILKSSTGKQNLSSQENTSLTGL